MESTRNQWSSGVSNKSGLVPLTQRAAKDAFAEGNSSGRLHIQS